MKIYGFFLGNRPREISLYLGRNTFRSVYIASVQHRAQKEFLIFDSTHFKDLDTIKMATNEVDWAGAADAQVLR